MYEVKALQDLLNQISRLLPEFQRGYVWNRDQVRGLMAPTLLDAMERRIGGWRP